MSLTATVQKLRNQDGDRKALAHDRDAFLAQWSADVEAVYALFDQALQWFVREGAAVIQPATTRITEDLLGEYDIPARIIEVVGRRIHLVPKARIVSGATGRLDLYREDRPSEQYRIMLLRGATDVDHKPDAWSIQDRRNEKSAFDRAIAGGGILLQERTIYRTLDAPAIQDSIDYVLNV